MSHLNNTFFFFTEAGRFKQFQGLVTEYGLELNKTIVPTTKLK